MSATPKSVYINLPVRNLQASTTFYEKLGFQKNLMYSNNTTANAVAWSDEIVVMLLTHEFFKTFIDGKAIPDSKSSAQVALCLPLDSREAVDNFVHTAEAHGGRAYRVVTPGTEAFMYGYEVEDPDGHIWEPLYMDATAFPSPENTSTPS
jgi:predicted lactoylglutathione lyase